MTRFARAKGSKASNERIPEAATSWGEMKQQLVEKNQQANETKKKQAADKQREQNYKNFLQEVEEEKTKNTKWAEFPTKKGPKKVEVNNNGDVKKKIKRKLSDSVKVVIKKQRKLEDGAENSNIKLKKKLKGTQEQVEINNEVKIRKAENKRKVSEPKVEDKLEDDETKPKKKLRIVTQTETFVNVENNSNKPTIKKKKRKKKSSGPEAGSSTENPLQEAPKPNKKKQKTQKVVTQNQGLKKASPNAGKKKEKGPLSEEDLKKIEKKKQRKIRQVEKRKLNKPNDAKFTNNQKPERRKQPQERMIINGKEVYIAYVDGFPIKKEDAERIHQLRKQMISKGLPRSEIKIALKLERRKAEKAFAREKKKVCFNCRKSGHNLSECPDLGNQVAETSGTGICFKCGSTEHTHFECKVVKGQEFKFASCFICHEQGHIARQCPDNARGLYPKGGACRVCGDVTHLKKDCPKYQAQQQQLEQSVQLETMAIGDNPDCLGINEEPVRIQQTKQPNKIIKF